MLFTLWFISSFKRNIFDDKYLGELGAEPQICCSRVLNYQLSYSGLDTFFSQKNTVGVGLGPVLVKILGNF